MFRDLKKLFGITITADDYVERGDWYVQLAQWEKAAADYARAVEINPADATVHCKLGTALLKGDNDVARAIACFDEALRLDPRNAEAYYERGVAYHNDGDHFQAEQDLNRAVEIDPNHANAHALLGTLKAIQSTRGKEKEQALLEETLHRYSEVIRLQPNDARRYEMRARLYRHLGDEPAALADEAKASDLRGGSNPEDSDTHSRSSDHDANPAERGDGPDPSEQHKRGVVSTEIHPWLTMIFSLTGMLIGIATAPAYIVWKGPSPLAGLLFLGGALMGYAIPVTVMRALVPAKCPKCGGRAYAEGNRPLKFACRACGHVKRTQWWTRTPGEK